MTISYSGNFFRLLVRWKGSIWRTTYKELIVYLSLFYGIKLFYEYGIEILVQDQNQVDAAKNYFRSVCVSFETYTRGLPLTFLLGFYVSNMVSRWWGQFKCLEWPEDMMSALCMMLPGNDEKSQRRRHTIARYINLTAALAWREVSSQIRSKYPKMRDLVEGGLLTENELNALDDIRHSCPSVRWMAPLHWTQKICQETLDDGPDNTKFVGDFLSKLNTYRQSFRNLFCYDWVCVPLVYTQIAVLATYSYFFFSLFGRQFSDEGAELTFPLFLVIEFLFIVGWLKVAHELMRPFGHGDDDIELHWILDRNIAVSFAIVHKLQNTERPKGGDDDVFWKNRHLKIEVPKTGNNEKVKPERPKMHSYVNLAANQPLLSKKAKKNFHRIPSEKSNADSSGPEFDPSREREDHPHLYW